MIEYNQHNCIGSSRVVGSSPLKGGEIGMTEFQILTVMVAFGTLVAAIIFGLITVFLGILNLLKKK
jgi:hypothetical protein